MDKCFDGGNCGEGGFCNDCPLTKKQRTLNGRRYVTKAEKDRRKDKVLKANFK